MLSSLRIVVGVLLLLPCVARAADPIPRSPHLPESAPWDLERLAEPPAHEWIDKQATVRSLFYEGETFHGRPTRVFAYYATPGSLAGNPALDKQLPAVVLIHGGGGTAFRDWATLWAEKGYAAIAMDLAGHRPIEGKNAHDPANRTRLEDGGPNQSDEEKFGSVDAAPQEQWPYHAVAAAIRAHSLIRSFPEVNRDQTAVTGISWGGYLTCIVAGVDGRFKAAVPVYGCGFLHENSAWLGRFSQMSPEQQQRWTQLWDPMQYLPAASMPMLWVNGTNDFAYPLDSYMKSYDLVSAPKQLCVTVNMPHSHVHGWAPKEIHLFIDHQLREGTGLAELMEPVVEGGAVKVALSSPAAVRAAAIHWTRGTEPINQRMWTSDEAKLDQQQIVAQLPEGVSAWFITVTDERDAIASTRVFFPAKD